MAVSRAGSEEWELRHCWERYRYDEDGRDRYGETSWGYLAFELGDVEAALRANSLEPADTFHRPILTTLAGAGLRVGEAIALDWCERQSATGTLTVGDAKTDAGAHREVDLPGGLIEALSEWKATRERPGA